MFNRPYLLLAAAATAWGQGFCDAPPRPEIASLTQVPQSQVWFRVYEVSSGVYAIHEPRQSQGTISYLITGSRKAILFDTGMGIGNLRAVIDELTTLPVTVMNSHTHHDHVGSNWQFTVASMDTEFTRQNAKGSREEAQAEIAPGEVCGDLPPGFDRTAYETRAWKITETLHDGEKLDLGGRMLEILATPGHTPDAICILDRANGLLFTGDTYYKGTIWLYRPETDLKAYESSIRRMAALTPDLKLVLGAHGVPSVPASVLQQLVTAFETVQAGKAGAGTVNGDRIRYRVEDIGFLMRRKP